MRRIVWRCLFSRARANAKRIGAVVVALLVVVAALSPAAQAGASEAGAGPRSGTVGDELQAALDDWRLGDDVHGAAARVYAPGRIDWSGSSGSSDFWLSRVPFAVDDQARSGSVTKMFTAVTVLQLVEEGLLSLDATLDTYLPGLANAKVITVADLLGHRSGMPEIQLDDFFFMLTIVTDANMPIDPEAFLYKWTQGPLPVLSFRDGFEFKARGPVAVPGEEFNYSQPGYLALGVIVEKVTGKSLAQNFEERIFGPLGMNDSRLAGIGDRGPLGYSNLFTILPVSLPTTWFFGTFTRINTAMWSAGGMISTAPDLSRFLQGVMGGELLSPESLDAMTDTRWIGDPFGSSVHMEYGLGLFRIRHKGFTTLGHGGSVPGGNAVMDYVPELDVYVTAVSNTDREFMGDNKGMTARVVEILTDAGS